MELPKRDKNHLICSKAEKTFCQQMPDNWIIRDLAREDYGVDYYIEVVDKDHNVTGDTFLVQLKGKQNVCFNKSGKHGTQIKTSTLNYWISLNVPVFLFVVDVTTEKMYQTPIKNRIRSNYEKIIKQSTFIINVNESSLFAGKSKINFFISLKSELHADEDLLHTFSFLMQHEAHFDFLEESIGRDSFLPVEPDDLTRLFHLLILSQSICRLAGETNCLIAQVVDESLKKDSASFQDGEFMHEMARDIIANYLFLLWKLLLPKILDQLKSEEFYWEQSKTMAVRVLFLDFDNLKHSLLDRLGRSLDAI